MPPAEGIERSSSPISRASSPRISSSNSSEISFGRPANTIGGLVRLHLFENVGGLLRLHLFDDLRGQARIQFGQGVCRGLFVERRDN